MEQKKICVCARCGTAFVMTRPEKKYCSRRCATISANRRKIARRREELAKQGTDCPYNEAIVCDGSKCDSCGWNPTVAKKRSARYGKTGN